MKTIYWQTGETESFNKLIDFLKQYANYVDVINKDEYGFSRTIAFNIANREYTIIWFINLCNLFIGNYTEIENRLPQTTFTSIKYDNCFPIYYNGNDNLSFVYNDVVIRIPLPRQETNNE